MGHIAHFQSRVLGRVIYYLCINYVVMESMLSPAQGNAVIDFSGTGPQVEENCNAPRAVTLSALIYCLRCMVGHDVPLNQVSVSRWRCECVGGWLVFFVMYSKTCRKGQYYIAIIRDTYKNRHGHYCYVLRILPVASFTKLTVAWNSNSLQVVFKTVFCYFNTKSLFW